MVHFVQNFLLFIVTRRLVADPANKAHESIAS